MLNESERARARCPCLRPVRVGAFLVAITAAGAAFSQPAASIDELRAEIAELRAQLEELETLRGRVAELEAALQTVATASDDGASVALEEAGDAMIAEEPASETGIDFGGALRFTYFDDSFSTDTSSKRGEAGLDLFRVNVDGALGLLDVSAEYRFYPYMQTIRYGWIGRDFDDAGRIEGGVTQVPFGLLPYSSHNFWLDIPFYLGFADDYDLGVKYVHEQGPWTAHAAFFKNDELNNASRLSRYSYDVVSVAGEGNEESNQLNLRIARRIGEAPRCTFDAGASAQRGELFNGLTGEVGERWAGAVHVDANCGRWNVQGQLMRYAFDPGNPRSIADHTMTVGAYEAAHGIASRGDVIVANVAYNLPVRSSFVNLVTCYNDYSRLEKSAAGFLDSELNVTGCVVNIGPTYTYFDFIRGKNMVYFGEGSLAGGGSADWETRFNINFGYYF